MLICKSIKNKKFAHWRVELSEFDFTIHHLTGKLNTAADALSRISSITVNTSHSLVRLRHEQFGHPGARRLFKLIQASKDRDALSNLSEMCSTVVANCQICAEVKPRWRTPPSSSVVHATEPQQRLSMDFMTGKPVSQDGYTNLLTIVDEHSRFLFAFPTKDHTSATVISCLKSLFQIFGPPQSLHSNRGPEFFSLEISHSLSSWNVHQSRTTPYNPTGNSQCERYNGVLWRTILCLLHQNQQPISSWPSVVGEALHCIRSLHCSATETAPHNRLFTFTRHIPPVPVPGTIPAGNFAWYRHFVRGKNDPSGDLVQIAAANPEYAVISCQEKKEMDLVNWKHLAPHPGPSSSNNCFFSFTSRQCCA